MNPSVENTHRPPLLRRRLEPAGHATEPRVATPVRVNPGVVLTSRMVLLSRVNQKSKARGRLDRFQVRVPPEQSELTWKLPASVSNRVILPFWLEVAVMLKTAVGRPFLVMMLAVRVPAEAKGR